MKSRSFIKAKTIRKKKTPADIAATMIDDFGEFAQHCLFFKTDQKSDIVYGLITWIAILVLFGAITLIILS